MLKHRLWTLAGAAWLLAGLAAAGEAPKDQELTARIAKLCKELGDSEYGNQSAHMQLVEIGEPAMPQLLEALKDPRPQARWWAVAATCKIGTDEGYQAALGVLKNDPHAFVRSTAVFHLGYFLKKGKDIWPAAEAALMDKDPEVGRWALELMVREDYRDLDKVLRQILSTGSAELRSYAFNHVRDTKTSDPEKAKAYLPLIRQLLGSEDPRVRYDAVHTIVTLMDSGQLDFLRETFLRDKHPSVKECALRCITVIPAPPVEAFELFIMGMESEDAKLRDVAAQLLRKAYKQYFGFGANKSPEERREAIRKWQTWYAQNRDKLQWHPDLRKFLLPGQRTGKPATAGGAGPRKAPGQ